MIDLAPFERRVHSQFEEDGILLELVRRINPPHSFVEFGAGNGEQNCTRILAEELGWTGVWIDGDPKNIVVALPIAERLGIRCQRRFLDLEAMYDIRGMVATNIGVLSLDVDGNDWHFWKALCNPQYGVRPAICIVEAQIQREGEYVMPYDADYVWDHKSFDCGASFDSMVLLGRELGYAYVGKCTEPHSPNLFFVRTDLVGLANGVERDDPGRNYSLGN